MVTVLLVEAHPALRVGLHDMLSATDEIQIVAHASSGTEAVRLAHATRPRVVLSDCA